MGIILYSPTLITDEKQSCFDYPKFFVMTMDDYRYWRNDNIAVKNITCFLPMNVQIDLALRQYYTSSFQLVKPEQGKTIKTPYHTLVCGPLTEMEKFYLFNYYNGEIPQFSSKTMNEFITRVQKARYYLAQECLNPPSGKISTMYNIADFYDNLTLQNELEFPLDRDQNYNSLFASYRIRRHISDELSCFKADLFIASHGEVVGRFYHFTDAPKQTKIRLNTQTRLNLVANNFNKTVLGTFVNLPTNFRDRYTIPDGGHLGHQNNLPTKSKPPTVILKSSILDITSPNKNKPIYKLQTSSKVLDLSSTIKSNFSPLPQKCKTINPVTSQVVKPKSLEQAPTQHPRTKSDESPKSNPKANLSDPSPKIDPRKSPKSNVSSDLTNSNPNSKNSPNLVKIIPKEDDKVKIDKTDSEASPKQSDKLESNADPKPSDKISDNSSSDKNKNSQKSNDDLNKESSPELTLHFTSSSNSPIINPDLTRVTQSDGDSDNKLIPPKKIDIEKSLPEPKPTSVDKNVEADEPKDNKNPKASNNKSKDSSTTTTSTTYSAIFQPEHITFIASHNPENKPADSMSQTEYESMHNVADTLTQLQIDFKNQLENLMLDYQRSLDQPQNSILPSPSQNTAFLNDINQLVKALENNTNKANEIRTHVLEAIFSIVNQHFHNPSGPLNPNKISLEHINSNNHIQRQVIAYLDNLRDSLIKIKPPVTRSNLNTPMADKKLLDIANNLYDSIQPLVQSIYEQFENARVEIEQNIRTTNLGLSKEIVPVNKVSPQPKNNPAQANKEKDFDISEKIKKGIYRRKKQATSTRKPLDDYYYPSSDEKQKPKNTKTHPNKANNPTKTIKITSQVKLSPKSKSHPKIDKKEAPKRRLRSNSDNPKWSETLKPDPTHNKENISKKTSKIPVPKISVSKKLIPDIPDSLHDVCSPTQEGMPPLEEISADLKNNRPKPTKRAQSTSHNSRNQKRRKKENRYTITDSSEEV